MLEKEVELKIEIAEDVQWLKDYDKMRGQSINKEIRELLIDSITGECSSCKHWIDTQKACKLDCPLDDKWELADKTIDELINKIMAIVAEEKERI